MTHTDNQQPTTEPVAGFVPLASNGTARLSREQLLSIFAGRDRLNAERDLLRELVSEQRERDTDAA